MKYLYKLTGIKQTKKTPYHPMGNGLSERFNHTLISMVGTLTSEKKKAWPKYLPDFIMAYNSSTHDLTGYSPYFVMFGRQPRLQVDVGITLEDDNKDFIKNQHMHQDCRAIKTKGMVFRYMWVYSKEDTMAHTYRAVVTS